MGKQLDLLSYESFRSPALGKQGEKKIKIAPKQDKMTLIS